MKNIAYLEKKAKQYRKELFKKFLILNEGHPGSIFSMMDILVTLYHCDYLKFDKKRKNFQNKLLISKGHATSGSYPILRDFGVIKKKDWENWGTKKKTNLRIFGNNNIPGIDVTSGSLGHGVGVGVGLAYSNKLDKKKDQVFVVISEGELYEGSTWEALLFAANYNLNNLNIIIDINSLIILGTTENSMKLNSIEEKIKSFNFDVSECDGHNFKSIIKSLDKKKQIKPKCILAKTTKGKGLSLMEGKANWHYWNHITDKDIRKCLGELE
jgi:transketolase